MNITVKKYTSDNFDGLKNLLTIEYSSEICKETLEKYYLNDQRMILIAEDIDKHNVLGSAFVEIQEDYIRPHKILYVTYVAVSANARKMGIGRKLFERIECMCSELNCTAIELTSADFREGAHRFYDALGFTKKKTTVFIKEI